MHSKQPLQVCKAWLFIGTTIMTRSGRLSRNLAQLMCRQPRFEVPGRPGLARPGPHVHVQTSRSVSVQGGHVPEVGWVAGQSRPLRAEIWTVKMLCCSLVEPPKHVPRMDCSSSLCSYLSSWHKISVPRTAEFRPKERTLSPACRT